MSHQNIRLFFLVGSILVTLCLVVTYPQQLYAGLYWLYEDGWETISQGFWLGFLLSWFIVGRRFHLTRYVRRK
ncbi:hypothetical protein NIES2135_64870 (plasmid) [Leptolyngbya boryana NIES-2135]|uniref:Uncharacterized protein n=1 Tax=Leptolyngbya boryana NIES-2135 TaxID=1973484 RepID=A0A1Z4JSF2_LEPBY|nr:MULTISPECIES: hypothetical protein [Leptolyngbya]BAY59610.1 hypothetical protein NIES2135_64870 [Leptolyngbya boryana NIES-2135]MBD2371353.1 hypothetical protein [Leptolyngbya sp. FACHB-161]MBD2377831.1 hypothetical protein [Leptolyngbya sp. FACHB-238]MBD2402268.1 hypothetical protein [Leptolyngbya sp. FACHB-239]MBD2408761.1 hypothetical protein [Leptolyngbya sp. FACHB-402]